MWNLDATIIFRDVTGSFCLNDLFMKIWGFVAV